jgi:hypothetical protein
LPTFPKGVVILPFLIGKAMIALSCHGPVVNVIRCLEVVDILRLALDKSRIPRQSFLAQDHLFG